MADNPFDDSKLVQRGRIVRERWQAFYLNDTHVIFDVLHPDRDASGSGQKLNYPGAIEVEAVEPVVIVADFDHEAIEARVDER